MSEKTKISVRTNFEEEGFQGTDVEFNVALPYSF